MYLRSKENFRAQHAPRPNVGGCSKTGEWKKESMIKDCIKCIEEPGYHGEIRFYCNGKCMSEYEQDNVQQHL